MRTSLALLAPLALASAGFTECDSFQTVTVPAADATPPQIVFGLHNGDRYERFTSVPGQDLEHPDFDRQAIAVVSAIDRGGVRRLTVGFSTSTVCEGPDGVSLLTTPLVVPEQDVQPGGPGSQASSGIWLARSFWPSQHRCPDGFTLTRVRTEWVADAENFHGVVSHSHGSVWWAP